MENQENKEIIKQYKAMQTNNLNLILQPWCSFRLYVVFKPPAKTRRHFYGNEHQCTYNQCMNHHVKNILMRKKKGYNDLVNLVEKTYRGKYQTAVIYMREPGKDKFELECRRYYNGGLEKQNDPILSDDEGFTLYFTIKNGLLVIQETNPEDEDFRGMMTKL
jgi:hypothetical protein